MPNTTALLIVDVQSELFAETPPPYAGEEVLATIGRLLAKARVARLPVIYIQHSDNALQYGTTGWQIHPDVAPQPGDTIVHKQTPDSFHETDLQERLQEKGIRELVIAGLQTEFCIDTTCRRAFSLGYQVTLVKDGHTTYDTEILPAAQIIAHHNNVISGWFADVKAEREIEFGDTP